MIYPITCLMKIEGTNLLLLTILAFWSSSRWAPEGREVPHSVVAIDMFQCMRSYMTTNARFIDGSSFHLSRQTLITQWIKNVVDTEIIRHRDVRNVSQVILLFILYLFWCGLISDDFTYSFQICYKAPMVYKAVVFEILLYTRQFVVLT